MKKNFRSVIMQVSAIACLAWACKDNHNDADKKSGQAADEKGTYAYDLHFLKDHAKHVYELHDKEGRSKVLLAADYQGRVMTSTAGGDSGMSFGWLNYDLLGSAARKKQFNPVGGEERFWLGPEGGQYALYFKKGDSFDIAHWQVPTLIDTVSYDVLKADSSEIMFNKSASLVNYSGTRFDIDIIRSIRLLNKNALQQRLNVHIPAALQYVAYESDNQVRNTGNTDWKKEDGLLSIWLLGMLAPGPQTAVIIPFKPVQPVQNYITDDYFGKVPPERLVVKDSVLYFNCDGKSRGKIGLSPTVAKSIAGSFDYKKNALTIIRFEVDKDGLYVNSKWEMQQHPFKGDVINAYNDGPLQDGAQMGPFYEVESSSSAKELRKGEIMKYRQVTCHFQGDYHSLDELAFALLGVHLDDARKSIIH